LAHPESEAKKTQGELARTRDLTRVSLSLPAIWPWAMQPRYPAPAVPERDRSDSSPR
jgi:hypothetical protein